WGAPQGDRLFRAGWREYFEPIRQSKEQLWSWACPDEVVNVVVLFVVDEDAAEVVAVSNMADAAMDAVAVVTDEAIDVIVSVVSVAAEDDVDDGTADC
ncbi:hypothetical protein PF006_g28935, partial [Phytophthora fragariae]